ISFGDLTDANQAIRSNLAACHTWHNRIGTIFLDIAEVVVVTILQTGMTWFQNKIIPAGCQNIGYSRFADITAHAVPMLLNQVRESLDFMHAYQVIQFLTRIGKMFAQVIVHRDTLTL